MKLCMVGQGAFANKHLDGLARIEGAEVVTICGGSPDSTEAVAKERGIPHWTTDLDESLAQPGVEVPGVQDGVGRRHEGVDVGGAGLNSSLVDADRPAGGGGVGRCGRVGEQGGQVPGPAGVLPQHQARLNEAGVVEVDGLA